MRITATVMAHPKRQDRARELHIELMQYPFADTSITFDEVNEEWHTGKRALLAGVGKGDFHVVIQDDAILTPDFYENIENAIKALDIKTIFSLYTGTSRPLGRRVKAAVDKSPDGSWLRHHQLFWGVGIVIPTDHILPMLEFVEDVDLQYDNKIGEFYCQNGLPVYYCIPSLVDHDDDRDSLLPGHGRDISPDRRVAHRLATGLVEWTNKKTYI
jgi:hypothetical protein